MIDNYIYYNRNPDDMSINDCVCSAISTISGLSYLTTARLLELVSRENGCDKLCENCYSYLLTEIFGFEKYKCHGVKIEQLLHDFPNNKLIIRIKGHLTAAINGIICDTWDCTSKYVDVFWVAK